MIFRYFPETDSLYVEFEPDQAAETVAVTDSFLIDFDSDSHIVGIDIDKASNSGRAQSQRQLRQQTPEDA